ncbi:hypothetical protein BY458DRAFT_511941 [Sporodiniella umbellata]|nr:hypothetical protein BY458DRAFT_511941 [Sporodiniella umbellata]
MKLLLAIPSLSILFSAQALASYPLPCQETYTAIEGDNYNTIAAKNRISQENLLYWNQVYRSPHETIKPGDKFCVKYQLPEDHVGMKARPQRGDVVTLMDTVATPTPQYVHTMPPMYY